MLATAEATVNFPAADSATSVHQRPPGHGRHENSAWLSVETRKNTGRARGGIFSHHMKVRVGHKGANPGMEVQRRPNFYALLTRGAQP